MIRYSAPSRTVELSMSTMVKVMGRPFPPVGSDRAVTGNGACS